MQTPAKAKRVRIYLSEDDRRDGRLLHRTVLDLLRTERAQGATVLRAIEGFGASGRLHASALVDVAAGLPLVVEWIDQAASVDRILPRVLELVQHGLVTVDETELVLAEASPVRDLALTVTVGDVMSREVASVGPGTPIRKVVELMLGRPYRAVPVVEGGRPVGIITNTDLVRRGGLGIRVDLLHRLEGTERHETLQRLAEQDRTAAEVMTPRPVTVGVGTSLPVAAELMARRRLKRLPVVDEGGALVGMVSRLDLLRTAAVGQAESAPGAGELGLSRDAPLSRVMRTDVPTVHPDTPLAEVFQAVVSTRLNRAFVVDAERKVVGQVSDAELLERVTPALRPGALRALMQRLPFAHAREDAVGAHARGRTAGDVMTRSFARAPEGALLSEAIANMLRDGQKMLAVTDADGRLVGVVDRADLLRGLVLPPA
jgi:CBS domain-containing protein/PII-like signaling protein